MPDERTPVLYLAPWIDLGGSDKGTIDWFKQLDKTRWAPSLITTQPAPNRWLHEVEPHAEETWVLPDLMPGSAFPEFILGFIESRGVQVVHIMNSRLAFDLMPDMVCLPEPPVIVVQLHAEEPDRSGYVRYSAARYGNLVDTFSVTSRQLREAMLDFDVPGSRIEVIYTGVDVEEEFDPAKVEPFDLDDGEAPRILWPGRLAEQKDPMLTLDVLALLRDRGVGFVMHLVGDGHLEQAVRDRAAELGVDHLIRWHPPSQEMARWYRSSDLLLMTSVFEGIPYVIFEALAMEVPIVAPALPGNVEFMDADSGVLVDPRDDAEQYADAVQALLEDSARRRAMGARSRERMRREFSVREMAERHEALYERLLAKRTAATRSRAQAAHAEHELPERAPVPEPVRLERTPAPPRTVGVVVPCYQHGRYLPACIESIRAQTLAPARVVVVDDASDDPETDAALRDLEAAGDVAVLRLERNSGPSVARNRALELLEDVSYVLPVDADDLLLPDALETMVAQLERAPADVGFVYPNPKHFGNRSDYVRVPDYNLHVLAQNNYCAATSLFDRRAFAAGVRYPEEVVWGHEDWDVVLQLAELGLRGEPAAGPTFLYRKRGFSRVNAVEYGPEAFHERIMRRHPALYARRNRLAIKAAWAPGLSLVLLGEGWDGAALDRQTCRDFEVLAASGLETEQPVRVVAAAADETSWLAAAVAQARGRFVLVARPALRDALGRPQFVEHALRVFWSSPTDVVAYAERPAPTVPDLTQLRGRELAAAEPIAVGWERRPGERDDLEAELGLTGDVVADIVLELQAHRVVQWRGVAVGRPAARPAARLQATVTELVA